MPRRYPAEFRRKVLDLLAVGRSVTEVAADLGVSGPRIYHWRKQDRIDRGETPGLSSSELSELTAARRRISALEAELAATKRAKELLKEAVPPKGRFAITAVMAEEGHSIKVTCWVLDVSAAGFCAWRKRAPSARAIRHAWLTDKITQIHLDSHRTYGALRVHAIPITARRPGSSGRSRAARWIQDSCPRWARSEIATTTPSSNRSGAGCRSSCSTDNDGTPAWNSRTRSSNIWRSSTTASDATASWGCARQWSTRRCTPTRSQWHECQQTDSTIPGVHRSRGWCIAD